MGNKINLFVYGTLMKDRRNHKYLENDQYIGNGMLKNYGLYNVNKNYPGIIQKQGCLVKGEIYKIESEKLEELDDFEGSEYVRAQEQILTDKEEIEIAYVYVWLKEVAETDFVKEANQPWSNKSA